MNTCITNASAGDTINITAGSATWSSGLQISKVLYIIGPGAGSLTITDALNDGLTALFAFNLTYGAAGCTTRSSLCARVSGLTIQPGAGVTNGYSSITFAGTCTSAWCPNVRLDHVTITGYNESVQGAQGELLTRADNVFGVFDHNTIILGPGTGTIEFVNINHSSWMGIGTDGDNSWAQPDTLGTAAALYAENNTFGTGVGGNDCDTPPFWPAGLTAGGCRFVFRFNSYTNTPGGGAVYTHGTETTGRARGGRHMEFYGNTLTSNVGTDAIATLRSGLIYHWGNNFTFTGGAGLNAYAKLYDYRRFACGVVTCPGTYGFGDGTGPYDQNDGVVYSSGTYTGTTGSTTFIDSSGSVGTLHQWIPSGGYAYAIHDVTHNFGAEISDNTTTGVTYGPGGAPICSWSSTQCTWTNGDTYQILRTKVTIDQPSRGIGGYLSGSTPSPTGWVNEVLDPSYEWLDTISASYFNGPFGTDTNSLIANRDWYSNQTSGCTGTQTTGVCSGALASRATNCTTGVGYFATDQGSWNSSGTNIPGQSFSQGELFVCGASGWPSSASYVPYSYPHPLTGNSGSSSGSGTTPNPPTGVVAKAK